MNADLFFDSKHHLSQQVNNPVSDPAYQAQLELQAKKKKKNSGGGAFEAFNLSPFLYKAIKQKGYNLPTPIQRKAIPVILEGFNVIAMARTGSGKTASFVIPIIEKLKAHSKVVGARCIILSPAREIALQTAAYFRSLCKHTDLTHALIVGGNDMEN